MCLAEFWALSHRLFNTTSETFPVPFIAGDIFDPAFLEPAQPLYAPLSTPPPTLSDVKTLTELRGHVSAISVCAVFHIFSTEQEQLRLARAIASLLSAEPGSMIVGLQRGWKEKGEDEGLTFDMFCHSPDSWAAMWDGQVFAKGTVKVDVRLVDRGRPLVEGGVIARGAKVMLEWAVTRL